MKNLIILLCLGFASTGLSATEELPVAKATKATKTVKTKPVPKVGDIRIYKNQKFEVRQRIVVRQGIRYLQTYWALIKVVPAPPLRFEPAPARSNFFFGGNCVGSS